MLRLTMFFRIKRIKTAIVRDISTPACFLSQTQAFQSCRYQGWPTRSDTSMSNPMLKAFYKVRGWGKKDIAFDEHFKQALWSKINWSNIVWYHEREGCRSRIFTLFVFNASCVFWIFQGTHESHHRLLTPTRAWRVVFLHLRVVDHIIIIAYLAHRLSINLIDPDVFSFQRPLRYTPTSSLIWEYKMLLPSGGPSHHRNRCSNLFLKTNSGCLGC